MTTNSRRPKSLNKSLTRGWNVKAPITTKATVDPAPEDPIATSAESDPYSSPAAPRSAGIRFHQIVPADSNPEPTYHRVPMPSSKKKINQASPEPAGVSPTPASAPGTNTDAAAKRPRGATGPDESDKRKKAATGSSSGSRKGTVLVEPTVRLADVGGVDACIEEVLEQIAMPLLHPEIYLHTGVQPPRGILLHGPPGCGKTLLANAIAGELRVPFLQISAPSVVSGMSGESEKKIREVFAEARSLAPCLMFIDEIDAITPKRETAQREMERRIVAQLLTCLDDLSWDKTDYKPVLIIGATNRADALDPALRRAGRFDREISMVVPDETARESILRVQCAKLRISGDFDFRDLAKKTPGYVGADLNALTSAAGMIAVKRIFRLLSETMELQTAMEPESTSIADLTAELESDMTMDGDSQDEALEEDSINAAVKEVVKETPATPLTSFLDGFDSLTVNDKVQSISAFLRAHPGPLTPAELAPLSITPIDFEEALKKVQPSSKREGFATVPDVSWADIGALAHVRDELRMAVVEPIRHPEYFASVGITAPAGVLLWGPPGCGKTLLAKAVANESHTNFISVKGPELLNKYVGESERAVRQVFARAKASSPCVVFFDELDALCGRRDENQSEASARVVNTLLTELDGMETRKQVFIIAATNRPDMIDPAMLRPGRLDKLLYVELPTAPERLEILRTLTRKTPMEPGRVDLEAVAHHPSCEGLSGADLASLVREAAVSALRETIYVLPPPEAGDTTTTGGLSAPGPNMSFGKPIRIVQQHFETAFTKVSPSVSQSDRASYQRLRQKFGLHN